MRLSITHTTRLKYSEPVTEEVMECRLGPFSDEDQRWERFELHVKPGGPIRSYIDGFGNNGYLVTLASSHESIELVAESQVTTLLGDPFALPQTAPRPISAQERFDYLAASRLIPLEPRLKTLSESVVPPGNGDPFEHARVLN